MINFDCIIKRVELLLGDTYNIRYNMSSFIAQRIISGFSDIIYKYEKGEC